MPVQAHASGASLFSSDSKPIFHKTLRTMSHEKFQSCIDACLECAAECNHCATMCLGEKDVAMMSKCIQLDRECSAACLAAAQMMSIGGDHATAFCGTCAEICDACAEECEKHDVDHCQSCAEACRECAHQCRTMARVAA